MPGSPVDALKALGDEMMRSNSGKDESRNNMRDPTMRDRDLGRGETATLEKKPKAPADHRQGQQDKSPKPR
jgi:hypothetical protein